MRVLACDGEGLLACINEVHATAAFKLARIQLQMLGESQVKQKVIGEVITMLKDYIVLQNCFTIKTQTLENRKYQALRMLESL